MNTYNNTTKADVKNLNVKQTVIIETVTVVENGKKKVTKNVYLGNWKRRRDAYYLGMQEDKMKNRTEEGTTYEYRLLKLSKLLAEVSVPGYNTKTIYNLIEGYDNEKVVAIPEEKKEEVAETTEEVEVEEVAQEEPETSKEEEVAEEEVNEK